MELENSGYGSKRMRFSVGDVVQIKSGGPAMTVFQLNDGAVCAEWFSGTKHQSGIFNDDVLEIAIKPAIIVKASKTGKKTSTHVEDAVLI
jgi:uncharacterized protein YodC (DUF2158 family)